MLRRSSSSRRSIGHRNIKLYLMVAPALVAVCGLFFAGLAEAVKQSFGGFAVAGLEAQFTSKHYAHLLQSEAFRESMWLSLRVSALSTCLAALLGVSAAVLLFAGLVRFSQSARGRWFRLARIPLLFPHLTAAYMVWLLLMQSGLLSRIAYHLGWLERTEQFPVLVNDSFGWGMIAAYVWKETPFILLMIVPVVIRLERNWRDVVRSLGGSHLHYVRDVVLPMLIPATMTASFIVFAFTFTAYEVPYLLGVTYPQMLSVFVYELYQSDLLLRPQAMAAGVLMISVVVLVGLIAYFVSRKWALHESKGWL